MGDARVSAEALQELRLKYVEMLAMRLEHTSGVEDVAQVRQRMGALAVRFPGALREIDDLELTEIRARIDALDDVLAGVKAVEAWMEAMALFHTLARGALVAKRWLRGRKHVTEALAREFAESHATQPFPQDAASWATELAGLASPPAGRWTTLVFARVARALHVDEREARRLVFGPGRRG